MTMQKVTIEIDVDEYEAEIRQNIQDRIAGGHRDGDPYLEAALKALDKGQAHGGIREAIVGLFWNHIVEGTSGGLGTFGSPISIDFLTPAVVADGPANAEV